MAKSRNLKSDLIADYKTFFTTEVGQRIINDLIRKHHVMTPSYCETERETVFREGQRFVVLNIMKLCKINPEQYANQVDAAKEEYDNDRSNRHIE